MKSETYLGPEGQLCSQLWWSLTSCGDNIVLMTTKSEHLPQCYHNVQLPWNGAQRRHYTTLVRVYWPWHEWDPGAIQANRPGYIWHSSAWEPLRGLFNTGVHSSFLRWYQIPLTCASTQWGYDMLICRCPVKNPLSHGWLEPTVNPRQEQLSWALFPPHTKRGGKNTWEFRAIYLYPLLTPKQQLNPQKFLEYERNCWPSQRGNLSFRKTEKLRRSLQTIQGQGKCPQEIQPCQKKWLLAPQPLRVS